MQTIDNPARGLPAIPATSRISILLAILIPFAAVIACAVMAWNGSLFILELAIMMSLYSLTMLGITVGFHRHFTHRAFQAHPAVRWTLAVLGSMAFQGAVLTWVAHHRRHHQRSDRLGDPHSPNLAGGSFGGAFRGFLHSHIGWLFADLPEDQARYVPDLLRDPVARRASRWFSWFAAAGLALPAVISGCVWRSWEGAWHGFLWGGLCRVFLVHHMTWSINSACHLWGAQPHKVGDGSRNNWVCALATFGEGWHNNHHAFPNSARHGWTPLQIDGSYWCIAILKRLGLVWSVRLPPFANHSQTTNPALTKVSTSSHGSCSDS